MRVTGCSAEYGKIRHIPIEAEILCVLPNFKPYSSQAYKKMKCGGTGELVIEYTPTGDALHLDKKELEAILKKVNAFNKEAKLSPSN